MPAPSARFIAVDWGTTHLRAFLVGERGKILDRVSTPEGITSLGGSSFADVLRFRCGRWLERDRQAPILMAGMVGSRNGWLEAPYLECPASLGDLSAKLATVSIDGQRQGYIAPGLKARNDGVADVLRGEETLVFGAGVTEGIVLLPGTHCKWAAIENGRVETFRTYMTGEFYALLSNHSVLRLLAEKPEDASGFSRGLAAADRGGGLLHQAFEARTAVLDGAMAGNATLPFLSGLLIASEIDEAAADFDAPRTVTLIAGGDLAARYGEALASRRIAAKVLAPETCLVRGAALLLQEQAAQ